MFAMSNDDRALVGSLRPRRTLRRPRGRRGVSSVLAMMFVVIFGSLTAVMAIVAQGNLRTAHSGLQLSRAMSAAETGLVFAIRRLEDQGARFVVEKGVIEDDFAHKLWLGTYDTSADGAVTILPPKTFTETIAATSIATAVFNAHVADSHSFAPEAGDDTLPQLDTISGTLRVQPIRLEAGNDQLYFRLRYELVSGVPAVRVISEGVDGQITRTLQLDFQITKKIKFAVLSPNRIMIGKNVRIDGPLGSRYGAPGPSQAQELAGANGHPLVMRSDYYFLSADLDAQLDLFLAAVAEHDQDNDGRLRPGHADEGQGVTENPTLEDFNGDEYVDEFDLFLGEFDENTDGRVVYDTVLAAEVGMSGASMEFDDVDDQLARLVDEYNADRDGDGEPGTTTDRLLGYRDGVMDSKDLYAKLHGSLAFAVDRATWETAHSLDSYQEVVMGAIRPDAEDAAAEFAVPDEELREVETSMFTSSSVWAQGVVATSQPFGDSTSGQVKAGIDAGGTYTAPSDATWECVPYIPYDAPAYETAGKYDNFRRPVYKNMTFTNVRIPKGTNALFEDCTFVGVTYVETQPDCDHPNWNFAGAIKRTEDPDNPGTFLYTEPYLGIECETGGTPVPDTKVESNNLRFHDCTFLGAVHGDVPGEFMHVRNKLQYTGNTRFFIDPNDPALDELPTAEAQPIIDTLNGLGTEMLDELAKSSILMPGWSIDVGNFINEVDADPTLTPKVKLKGTIIAGILDVRGTADVFGTMLMTFRPEVGVGALAYGSMPDVFNTTIGYFGPADGDGEGLDPTSGGFLGFGEITIRYNPDAKLPDGIPWPITVDPIAESYLEGGS